MKAWKSTSLLCFNYYFYFLNKSYILYYETIYLINEYTKVLLLEFVFY